MREIDCSNLPDELAHKAIQAAEESLEQYDENDHPNVNILTKSQLIVINGDDDELYGYLTATVESVVRNYLNKNHEKYTEEEHRNIIKNGVKRRKA